MSNIVINVCKNKRTERWGWSIYMNEVLMWESYVPCDKDGYENKFDATEAALKIASFHTFEITEEME